MKKVLMFLWGAGLLANMFIISFADTRGPQISWVGPREGMVLSATSARPDIGIRVRAVDPDGIKKAVMHMAHGHYDRGIGGANWSRIWDKTFVRNGAAPDNTDNHFGVRMMGRSEGEYTLYVVYTDNSRRRFGKSVSYRHFFYDNSPPEVKFTNLRNNNTVCKDRNLKVKISASDAGTGIKQVTLLMVYNRGNYYVIKRTAPYEFTIDKRFFTNDSHTLKVIATDKAGKKSTKRISIKPVFICNSRRIKR